MNVVFRQRNEKGFTLVGAVITLTLAAYMSASVLEIGGSGDGAATNEFQTTQALHVGNGGIQYALQRLDLGLSPDVQNKPFGAGTFTVATDPVTRDITVTGNVGEAKKIQGVTSDFSSDATSVDATPAYLSANGRDIEGMEIKKYAHTQVLLASLKVVWNSSMCAQTLSCSGTSQTVCHAPPGNPDNKHSITVGSSAVDTHLAHGDTLGTCTAGETAPPHICEGYDQEVAQCAAGTDGAKVTGLRIAGDNISFNGEKYENGEVIDIPDHVFSTDQNYESNEIGFDTDLPEGTWYSVTFTFADGSEITKSFKFDS
jgi:hypothetical protein